MPDTTDTTPAPEDVQVGATIRTLREARGLSQSELGQLIGVSQPLISFIEAGERRKAVLANCDKLAKALSVPVARIVGEEVAALIKPAQASR